MKRTFISVLCVAAILLEYSCTHKVSNNRSIGRQERFVFNYDLEGAADNDSSMPINLIADSIAFIPLEFDISASLRPDYLMTVETDSGFMVSSNSTQGFNGVFLFGKDGSFKRCLIGKGRGHNELIPYYYNWTFNHQDGLLVLSGRGYHCLYNIKNEDVSMLKNTEFSFQTMIPIDDRKFLSLPTGENPQIPFLVLTDIEGKTIKKFSYKKKRDIYAEIPHSGWSPIEHYVLDQDSQGRPLFKDMYNDTIYSYSDNELQPVFCLNTGEKKPKPRDIEKNVRKQKQIYVYHTTTVGKYLLCFYYFDGCRVESVFDRETGKVVANERLSIGERGVHLWNIRAPHFMSLDTPTGKHILVGVTWSSGEYLYGVVNQGDVSDFLALEEDSNPVLVKIHLMQ